MAIGSLQAKHLLRMAQVSRNEDALVSAVGQLGKRLPTALAAREKSDIGPKPLRASLQERMEKRWNGSFGINWPLLSKKRSKGAKAKG